MRGFVSLSAVCGLIGGVTGAFAADDPVNKAPPLPSPDATPYIQKIIPPPPVPGVSEPPPHAIDAAADAADVSVDKRHEIERMIRASGIEKMFPQMKALALQNARRANLQISEEVWRRFAAKVDAASLLNQMVPVYDRYFSLEELRAINAFYETPAGKKITTVMPGVMDDLRKAGERWAIHVMKETLADLDRSPPSELLTPTGPPSGRTGDAKPVPILHAPPIYPPEMSALNVKGEVLVDFIVEPDGTTSNVRALRGTNAVFGNAAVECVKSWRFQPGLKDGRPVRVHLEVPIIFQPRGTTAPAATQPSKPTVPDRI